MTKTEKTAIQNRAKDHYGFKFEAHDLQEECAEVIQAVNKFLKNPKDTKCLNNLFEEIADTEILFEQMKLWFPTLCPYVERVKEAKLKRVDYRIRKDIERQVEEWR